MHQSIKPTMSKRILHALSKDLTYYFINFLQKKVKICLQLQLSYRITNYATKLFLSDLNLTLKILPANLTLCVFRILSSNTTVKLLFGNGRLQ